MPSNSLAETQQQLDELETLIRQMLALPAEPARSLPPPPVFVPDPVDHTATAEFGLPEHAMPLVERIDRLTDETSVAGMGRPHFDPAPGDELRDDALSIMSVSRSAGDSPAESVSPRRPSASHAEQAWRPHAAPWLFPFIWLNRTFDRVALRCGSPGAALVHDRGRNFLGWTGVALIVGALAWAFLDWVVWTW